MENSVTFFLNGKRVTIENPHPDLLLIDYLRSPEVGLTGAKKGCGQGGCGACTVILSHWDDETRAARHAAINSCLRPVCALDGLAVTTIEGTGRVTPPVGRHLKHSPSFSRSASKQLEPPPRWLEGRKQALEHGSTAKGAPVDPAALHPDANIPPGINPVAFRLAENNGTQCGYCTVGFVMNMSAFLAHHPSPTKREIEDIFDGNICRCTGYRSILTGMKTFASDWSAEDERNRMKCLLDDGCLALSLPGEVSIPFPDEAQAAAQPIAVSDGGRSWITAPSLEALRTIVQEHDDKRIRLVFANTSFGVYADEYPQVDLFVDIRLIPELHGYEISSDGISVGAGTTYTDLIAILEEGTQNHCRSATSNMGALHFMARRTAGTILRNAASMGGNSMLVLKHIYTGAPFPSDLFTTLAAIDAEIELFLLSAAEVVRMTVAELVQLVVDDANVADDMLLLRYYLPYGREKDVVLPQKVALRQVNSHSIVNATTRIRLDDELNVEDVSLTFGGIAPYPWRPVETEAVILSRPLALENMDEVIALLLDEVAAERQQWQDRLEGLPSEGFTEAYIADLAAAFLYKAVVKALLSKDPALVPPELRSSAEITWGNWPVSDGRQSYKSQAFKEPVAQPYIKLMAMYQASGQVHYTHEIELPTKGVNAAFVQSERALADYYFRLPDDTQAVSSQDVHAHLSACFDAFIALITHEHIPLGGANYQGMGQDQPLLADKRVSYVGQAIALVVAETEQAAIEIATYASKHCVGYAPVDWPAEWQAPILTLEDAIEKGSIFPDYPEHAPYLSHVWKITRPGTRLDWTQQDKAPLDKRISVREGDIDGHSVEIVGGAQRTGGQIHFYMETQSCVAQPLDGQRYLVQPSSQSPMEMHQTVAMALGVEQNRVEVHVRQLGGAYGGKTEQARFVAGPTAVAAHALNRPVRLAMQREQDTRMIGKRHPYYGQYEIAVDRGESRAEDRGIIRGLKAKMWGDGGAFYDCSFIVLNNIQLRSDNAYNVANFENEMEVCRTNTAPNTAFRAFGDIQAQIILENAVDDAAFALGMAPELVREKNLYYRGDVTPYGQALPYCYMREVWAFLKETCDFETKQAEVEAFNRDNTWRKRGIAMIPVKYGSGYNLVQLEQATAVVSVYAADGTVVINQGGVDMGQGMMTKAEQIAAYTLNLPMHFFHIEGARTSVIPNPSSTGASTGTAYNGEAIRRACMVLRSRLMAFGQQMLDEHGNQWCKDRGIDYWNYGEQGWAAELPGGEHPTLVWQNLVQLAYQERVSLVISFNALIEGGTTPVPAMQYKPLAEQPHIPDIPISENATPGGAVDQFLGFTYSAACSVVELDVLTGEVKILSSDISYDMGWSLNPAIDIGQIEGAFVQGIGYVLTENLVYEQEGDEKGRLNTLNTWRYKPPAITTIPLSLNVHLFPRDLASDVPENPNTLFSSKEVGEPPLVLATSVFFALKAAIRDSRRERGLSGYFRLDAPATVQEVRRACFAEE